MPDGGSFYEKSASILSFGRQALEVSIVESYPTFCALKSEWQALEALDPRHSVFLSWSWLNRIFRDNPGAWRVLVVRNPAMAGRPVCILPLCVTTYWNARLGAFRTALGPANRLIGLDAAGWLCHPDYAEDAIRVTAGTLRQMPWAQVELHAVPGDPRLKAFTAAIATDATFSLAAEMHADQGRESFRLDLPDTYEAFRDAIGQSKTRKTLRRMWTQQLKTGKWRITFSDAASAERDIEIFETQRRAVLEAAHGPEAAARIARNQRAVLTNAAKAGCLCLAVLWEGDQPLAVQGHILDHDQERMYFVAEGRASRVAKMPVGLLLHAHSIKWAIARGLTEYRFNADVADHAAAFGAERVRSGAIRVLRGAAGMAGHFDRTYLPEAQHQACALHAAGDVEQADAARGYLASIGG